MNNLLGQAKMGLNQAPINKISILTLGLFLSLFLVMPFYGASAARINCRANILPVAKFSPLSPIISLGATVVFDGSESSDADGQALEYDWTVRRPNLKASGPVFSFTPAETGLYIVKLKVTDECWGKSYYFTSVVTVQAASPLNRCLANAQPQAVIVPASASIGLGESVAFNAFNSFDAESDSLSYEWLVDGALQSSAAEFIFTATSPGNFVVTLQAQDLCGRGETSASLTVTRDAGAGGSGGGSSGNGSSGGGPTGSSGGGTQCTSTAPTAVAGQDLSVLPGAEFVLDGTASTDPENDVLSYRWSIQSINFEANIATTSLSINDPGIYEAKLVVGDSCSSADDIITITVETKGASGAATTGSAESGTAASDKSSQAEQLVLGEETEFIPPLISPRAGQDMPIKEIGFGILSGWIFGLSVYFSYRKKLI